MTSCAWSYCLIMTISGLNKVRSALESFLHNSNNVTGRKRSIVKPPPQKGEVWCQNLVESPSLYLTPLSSHLNPCLRLDMWPAEIKFRIHLFFSFNNFFLFFPFQIPNIIRWFHVTHLTFLYNMVSRLSTMAWSRSPPSSWWKEPNLIVDISSLVTGVTS